MFQIVVDTDTAPATPNYFADLEKTVPAPSVIPLVQGFRGKVRVYFVGEHVPAETAGLALYVRPMNQKGKAVETAVASQQSDDDGNVFYDIDLVADTTALEVAIGARENVVMRGGLVAYDASVNPPTQIEWQMDLGVSASALGYGQTPPIPPNALEEHNLNESSHPFLLEKIRVLETEVSENNSELKTEISELEETVSANNSELKTEISELAGTVASNYSELSELAGTVASNHSELKTELSELAETVATENSEIISELSVLEQTVSTNKSELKTEISEVASELSALETELSENYSELKTEVSELAGTVASNYSELKTEISEVDSEVSVIKSNYVTTDTDQVITGDKVFRNTSSGMFPLILCSVSQAIFGFSTSAIQPNIIMATGVGTDDSKTSVFLFPRCAIGTLALTKNITTCTTAVKSELRSELDAISGDLDCFGRLSADNTWEGFQFFKKTSFFCDGAHLNALSLPLDAQIHVNEGQYSITVPNKQGTLALTSDIPDTSSFVTTDTNQVITGVKTFKHSGSSAPIVLCSSNPFILAFASPSTLKPALILFTGIGTSSPKIANVSFPVRSGTLALTCDIPDTSGFATLTGSNNFSEYNSFYSGLYADCGIAMRGALAFCDGNPYISAKGKEFYFPDTGGTLVVDTQLTNLTSNLSAICKTTVSNYGTITPTAGTLYFLTNS